MSSKEFKEKVVKNLDGQPLWKQGQNAVPVVSEALKKVLQ